MDYKSNNKTFFKFLYPISMFYMMIKLSTLILIYKIISIGPFTATASTLIMPLWFILGDIIAEVYGYRIAKAMIWYSIIFQFLFAFTCAGFSSFHILAQWPFQSAYDQLMTKFPRVAFASFFAVIIGGYLNAYLVSKWKILLRSKYFFLRSLGATIIGEFFFTIIAYFTEFYGVVPTHNILNLISVSFFAKLMINPILIISSMLITILLKKNENLEQSSSLCNPLINPISREVKI
jgi:queuosine precursor transporter